MAENPHLHRVAGDQSVIIGEDIRGTTPAAFRLSLNDRFGHVLAFGAGSSAQEAFLWNMMVQDIEAGAGVCLIDVTGKYARPLLDAVPPSRANHALYFQLGDDKRVVGFNAFHGVPLAERSRAAQGFMALFIAIWKLEDDSHPLMLRLLRASARALLDSNEGTLLGMYALFTNTAYRKRIVAQCQDSMTRRFWTDFEVWKEDDRRDKPQPVLTRLEAFLSDPHLRCVLGQTKSTLDMEHVVQNRQLLLADLPRLKLGAETSKLFGSLLLTRMQTLLEARPGGWPFYIYIPEAHHLHVALAARAMTSQFKNAGVVASIDQLTSYDRDHQGALLNAANLAAFRLSPDDARKVAARFPIPKAEVSLSTLQKHRLAVSDVSQELNVIDSIPAVHRSRDHILRRSQNVLTVPRKPAEQKITNFLDGLAEDG